MVDASKVIPPLQQKRLQSFQLSLPSSYQHFSLSKYPRPQIAEKLFTEWQSFDDKLVNSQFADMDRPGLILHGPPRTGKTKLACELVRRAIVDEHFRLDARFISAVQWATEASARAFKCELHGWADQLLKFAWRDDCEQAIVLLDDIDKVRATPAIQSELFNLIETITANDIYLFVTTNATGQQLQRKFDDEFGEAILARLWEFCVPVDFSKEDA